MEFINPKITIENTDQAYWVVRFEQQLSECEYLDIRLKVRRAKLDLRGLQQQVMAQTQELLTQMQSTLASGRQGDG